MDKIWHHHFTDSVGLYNHIPSGENNYYLASPAGLLSMAFIIIVKRQNREQHIKKIESDNKKCIFLKEYIRTLKLNAIVINERIDYIQCIESAKSAQYDIITPPALAEITTLISIIDSLPIKSVLLKKSGK